MSDANNQRRFVTVDVRDGVLTLTLNRPEKRNALCVAMRDDLAECLRSAARDPACRVVVLTGAGEAFCAGFDLAEIVSTELRPFTHGFEEFDEALHALDKPSIAAVEGPALAGGFALALATDFIVASETAKFGWPEISFGIPTAVHPLCLRVGAQKAKWLSLTGETIDATEARRIGLVDRVVPRSRAFEEAQALAQRLSALPVASVRAVRRASRVVYALPWDEAQRMQRESLLRVILSEKERILSLTRDYASARGIAK